MQESSTRWIGGDLEPSRVLMQLGRKKRRHCISTCHILKTSYSIVCKILSILYMFYCMLIKELRELKGSGHDNKSMDVDSGYFFCFSFTMILDAFD
jgi:hypothetical protein